MEQDRFSTEILLVPGSRVQFLDRPANGNGAPASNGEAAATASAPAGGVSKSLTGSAWRASHGSGIGSSTARR